MRNGQSTRSVATANGGPPKKILFIRWKCLGDVLFTIPAFRCVRAHFPDSRITYMTSREYAPLLEGFWKPSLCRDNELRYDSVRQEQRPVFHPACIRERPSFLHQFIEVEKGI